MNEKKEKNEYFKMEVLSIEIYIEKEIFAGIKEAKREKKKAERLDSNQHASNDDLRSNNHCYTFRSE